MSYTADFRKDRVLGHRGRRTGSRRVVLIPTLASGKLPSMKTHGLDELVDRDLTEHDTLLLSFLEIIRIIAVELGDSVGDAEGFAKYGLAFSIFHLMVKSEYLNRLIELALGYGAFHLRDERKTQGSALPKAWLP